MILSVSNHKGGVGKTTVSTLLAAYTARHTDKKILLVDADHNRGSSSIFFSNKEPECSIFDAFQCYAEDPYDTVSISGTMKKAVVKADGYDNLFVLQSSRKLAQITALGLEAEALKDMIEIAHFDRYALVIIDSGTVPVVVSMCITACDRLLIPMMMSQQCIGPTRNTINLAKREQDDAVHIDICYDADDELVIGAAAGRSYVAEIDIPARRYEEVENPDYDPDDPQSQQYILTPVPLDMDTVTLTLWAIE